eukprot:gene21711-biopygen1130
MVSLPGNFSGGWGAPPTAPGTRKGNPHNLAVTQKKSFGRRPAPQAPAAAQPPGRRNTHRQGFPTCVPIEPGAHGGAAGSATRQGMQECGAAGAAHMQPKKEKKTKGAAGAAMHVPGKPAVIIPALTGVSAADAVGRPRAARERRPTADPLRTRIPPPRTNVLMCNSGEKHATLRDPKKSSPTDRQKKVPPPPPHPSAPVPADSGMAGLRRQVDPPGHRRRRWQKGGKLRRVPAHTCTYRYVLYGTVWNGGGGAAAAAAAGILLLFRFFTPAFFLESGRVDPPPAALGQGGPGWVGPPPAALGQGEQEMPAPCPRHARATPAPPQAKKMPIARATPAPCPRHARATVLFPQ